MLKQPQTKYRAFAAPRLPDRQWPGRQLSQAPRWCSTDLRDGNQALIEPMGLARKRRFFELLVAVGYREIEVAFPAASQTDFDFVRELVTADGLPDDLWLQVMTPARSELIDRTFAALIGAPRAIVHLYNATAPVFRRVVFGQDRAATLAMAVAGTRQVRARCDTQPETAWTYQYSPETFCFTEADFALEICQAVREAWQPSTERPLILNLPATVEVATPNVYADQIEGFIRGLGPAPHVTISVHPHNDRGTGVACAELAQLAGATRVEGCLFGNGERTGNVDLVTLALNLYSQGVDPGLDFSRVEEVASVVEACNQLAIHPRHPYGGRLALASRPEQGAAVGLIDPADLGLVARLG